MAGIRQAQPNLILGRFVELLKEININAGDATTPALVTREFADIEAFDDYPVLIVTEGVATTVTHMALNKYEIDFPVFVWGYVRQTEGRTRSEWLEDLSNDVLFKILGATAAQMPQADTGVQLVTDVKRGPRIADGGGSDVLGAFSQEFRVIYQEAVPGG